MDLMLSPSLVLTYGQCPRRAKFQLDGVEGEEQEQLVLGTKFHEDVNLFFDKIDVEKLVKLNENEEAITAYFRGILPKNTQYDKLLDSFANIEAKRWCLLKNKSFYFPVLKEEKIYNKQLNLSGIVDRVDQLENEEYVVIDYKTGSFRKSNVSKLRFQLSFYATLIDKSNILDKEIKYICGYFPKETPPNHIFFEELKPKTVKAMWKRIENTKKKILSGKFKKNISFLCDYCPYCKICLESEFK